MSDDRSTERNPGDQIRDITDNVVDGIGGVVDNIVASEGFSAAVASYMDGMAIASSTLRGVTHRASGFIADWINAPTRDQLTGVAERITRLELAVDDIEMNTESLQRMLNRDQSDG